MAYYFEIQLIFPEEEPQFLNRQLSKRDLSEVTQYLQQKTSRGIPVKFRVGIFRVEDQTKIMSVTLNTKTTKETDVRQLLMNRVTDQQVLVYLNEPIESTHNKQETPQLKQKETEKDQNERTNKPTVTKKEEPLFTKESHQKESLNVDQAAPKKKSHKISSKAHFCLSILSVIIVLLIGTNVIQQIQLQSVKKESESLKKQIDAVKETDRSQSKIDTFGRYFLTYYFLQEENQETYQSSLRTYVSEKVNLSDWKALGKTLKSINYYGSEQTKEGYRVAYLLNVSVDNRSKMQKITFNVEPTKDGFLVTTQPKLTDFSFN